MTVKELIEVLKEMPQDAKVASENGYILENVWTKPKELIPGDNVWLVLATSPLSLRKFHLFSAYDIDD